jgi:hypothetical protein
VNKREFLVSLGIGLLGAARPALAAAAGPAPRRRRPKNWVSIPSAPSRTEDEWSALFERLHANAIEAVTVETRGDELQTVLSVSRRHALEVHARVALEKPEVARSAVASLADTPTLFGVHLDPLGLHGSMPWGDGTPPSADGLTALVNGQLVPAARSRGTLITAAVPAATVPRWSPWALDAFVAVVAEATDAGARSVGPQMADAVAAVAVPVYCGLLPRSLDASALAEASRSALANGAAGVALLGLDAMDESRWTAFQQTMAAS